MMSRARHLVRPSPAEGDALQALTLSVTLSQDTFTASVPLGPDQPILWSLQQLLARFRKGAECLAGVALAGLAIILTAQRLIRGEGCCADPQDGR